jgi:hypothetical protein
VSEDRKRAVARRQVAAAAKEVTATQQFTVAAAAMARMQPGAREGQRGGGTAAWPRVASAVMRQPTCSVGWYCSTRPGHAAVGRRGLLASGPDANSFSKFSKPTQLCNSIW